MNKNMCFIFILFVWINHRPDLGCSTSNIYLLWVRTLCIFILEYAWLQCSNCFCTQKQQANTYTKFIRILPVIGLQFWLCQNFSLRLFLFLWPPFSLFPLSQSEIRCMIAFMKSKHLRLVYTRMRTFHVPSPLFLFQCEYKSVHTLYSPTFGHSSFEDAFGDSDEIQLR